MSMRPLQALSPRRSFNNMTTSARCSTGIKKLRPINNVLKPFFKKQTSHGGAGRLVKGWPRRPRGFWMRNSSRIKPTASGMHQPVARAAIFV